MMFNGDGCYDYFSSDSYDNKVDLISDLKESGWKIEGEKHYCPKCKSKVEKAKELLETIKVMKGPHSKIKKFKPETIEELKENK